MVAAGIADEVLVQLAYAIGVASPVGLYINTYGKSNLGMPDSDIAEQILSVFDLRPGAIEERLKLRNPIYLETATYGHMGRTPATVVKSFESPYQGKTKLELELFTWEKLDFLEQLKNLFQI